MKYSSLGQLCLFLMICAVLCFACTGSSESDNTSTPPNIILIVADDLGFSDLGCYGSEIQTPNLDNLAKDGVSFSQFYNAARCCPSRASLMTGVYPHEAGIGHMMKDYGVPAYRGNLSDNVVTIAEVLKNGGYKTFMVGKWHLTNKMKMTDDKSNWPTNRGFDRYYGTLDGFTSFFDPVNLIEDTSLAVRSGPDFYYTDAIGKKALEYLKTVPEGQPYFLYVANMAPHFPLHARAERINKYEGAFDVGWDTLRRHRYEKLIDYGLISQKTPLSERDPMSLPWVDEEYKEWQSDRMEVFAAMVDHMDENVGKIVDFVKERGELENTLILFLSDNGGSAEGHLHGMVERLGVPWKSGVIPDTTSEGIKVVPGDFPGEEIGSAETFASYGPKWSNLSNTPFRLHKSWVHEGGISSPLIAYWPDGIKNTGRVENYPCHIIDIMATCIDVARMDYPKEFQGNRIKALRGKSLAPIFRNEPGISRAIFWEHEGNKAIRKGDWKLVAEFPGAWRTMKSYPWNGEWELYNMETDRTESRNLAAQFPTIVDSLRQEWTEWSQEVGVLPMKKLEELGFKN